MIFGTWRYVTVVEICHFLGCGTFSKSGEKPGKSYSNYSISTMETQIQVEAAAKEMEVQQQAAKSGLRHSNHSSGPRPSTADTGHPT